MTESAARKEPLVLSADADPLDDLFDEPETGNSERDGQSHARRAKRRGGGSDSSAILIALIASLVWIAAVAAFCWSRYSLPDNPGDAMDVVGTRISTGDWMLILAAILGPLVLIWTVAWLMRRTSDLKRQSQELASAAMRLTHAAQSAEAAGRPLALTGGTIDDVSGETPRHLRREVERATHAISALHSQMRAIEEALSTQARNIDDVAERAEKRARTIASTLRTEREALERASAEYGDGSISVSPASAGSLGTGAVAAGAAGIAGLGAAAAAGFGKTEDMSDGIEQALDHDTPSDVTDFALDEARVEAAADSDAADDLLTDAPDFARDETLEDDLDVDSATVDITAQDRPGDTNVEEIDTLRAALADAKSKARWERPVLSQSERNVMGATDLPDLSGDIGAPLGETVDPFDDLAEEASGIEMETGFAAGAAAGAAGAVGAVGIAATADASPVALDSEPEEFETLNLDTVHDEDGAPFKLERRHMMDWKKFTRAANFPESEEDVETLDALYDVLTDPEAASLLQCAEDTLASLADIDLYMEDFAPSLVPVTTWKSHLDGSGGEAIKGIDAPVEQSRIRAKLNADKGFEHLCAKFMDRYETMGRRLMSETDDPKLIVDLSNTRTGRAYLMISEAAGRLSA